MTLAAATHRSKHDAWNRCQDCGRFISMADIHSGAATHIMLTPDSDVSSESWETLCPLHSRLVERTRKSDEHAAAHDLPEGTSFFG